MPALPDAPGVIRTALSGSIVGGGGWLVRHYIHYSGTAPTNAQLATFDGSVVSAYGTDLKGLAQPSWVLTQVESADLSSPTSAVDITAASVAGTRAGTGLDAQTCVVTSYKIARRYRGGHPRGYWPWGVSGDTSTVVDWSPTFVTTCTTQLNAYFTALLAAGWTGAGTLTHVNVSYFKGFTVVVNPITGRARNVPTLRVAPTVDTVTGITVQPSIGTQRRRVGFID